MGLRFRPLTSISVWYERLMEGRFSDFKEPISFPNVIRLNFIGPHWEIALLRQPENAEELMQQAASQSAAGSQVSQVWVSFWQNNELKLTACLLIVAQFRRAGGNDCLMQLWEVASGLKET